MATFTSTNPSTGETLWMGHEASITEVDHAVRRAKQAFKAFSRLSLEERLHYVHAFGKKLAEKQVDFAEAISQEMGKPRWEALLEVKTALSKIEISIQSYHDRTPTRESTMKDGVIITRHHPQGVLGVMSPFNFPIHLAHGHIVPALIAGNTIVLKPSELVPMCAALYVDLWKSIGLPEGVIECIQGGPLVGSALVSHPDLRGLLFTGSEHVGRQIHAQFGGHPEKILALEMGGNNPLVVLDVPNQMATVNLILQSAFLTSGQRCTCARRLIIQSSPQAKQLIDAVIAGIPTLQVGDPAKDPEPFMGPLVTTAAADKIMVAEQKLIAAGGTSLVALTRPVEGKAWLTPGLIDCTGLQLPDEEYFGPLLKLHWVDNRDEAITLANQTRFGLSASVVCQDRDTFEYCYERMHAGLVHWNRPTNGGVSEAPFGGVGMSGNHRPTAYYAADYCAHPVVSLQTPPEQMSIQPMPGMLL